LWLILLFGKAELKQIYCSKKSQKSKKKSEWFSIISVITFEVNIVAEQKQKYW